MKGKPVDQLVYEYMFPKPRAGDPQNFHALLQRSLILEVRSEVHSFYGHLDTEEAKYPGLDYCNNIHRIRLSRWPWHRRLFRAFDNLRLTDSEISNLTKWEGTKWAKERYEKEQGKIIRDTAGDGFPDWVDPEFRSAADEADSRGVTTSPERHKEDEDEGEDDDDVGAEDSDDEAVVESVGNALNERLMERVARREAGDTATILDEEWEQWLKNAIESGELPDMAEQILRQRSEPTLVPQRLFPPRMLSAARAGQWSEIPEFLHAIIRRTLETENPARTSNEGGRNNSSNNGNGNREIENQEEGDEEEEEDDDDDDEEEEEEEEEEENSEEQQSSAPAAQPPPTGMPPLVRTSRRGTGDHVVNWRRRYSDLRLPAGESAAPPDLRIQRPAGAPGA